MENIIIYGLKIFFINLFTYSIYRKILNYKVDKRNIIIACILSVFLSIICTITKIYTNSIISIAVLYFLFSYTIGILNGKQIGYSMLASIISFAICFLLFGISIMLSFIPYKFLGIDNQLINLMIILIVQTILVCITLKIRRFKNGLIFLQNQNNNDYIDIIMINISAIVMLAYCLFNNSSENFIKHIFIPFIMLGIIMIIVIQKMLTLYYKQKLLEQNLKSYEQEIADKDKRIQDLSDEKFKISKVNHEFYNRQRALEMAVKEFISNSNMETSKEIMIMDKIESLSKEYSGKIEEIKKVEKLPETEIEEIDEMFRYMQSECIKNNIEFSLKINGNIFYMINNLIDKDRLVTLIGDHIRDAIIAINHSDNNYRSIVATLGMNDNCYEFRVYDTGIEFEIDTLLKLGIEPATTHAEEGGSGIGFITTFETMKICKASLIIEEKNKENDNDYTKAVIIKFDGKNEYRILSYRASEIKNKCKDNRIKIDNK